MLHEADGSASRAGSLPPVKALRRQNTIDQCVADLLPATGETGTA